ncbi:MAG: 16S rRNA (adenine(1518)-N(6)/adenine(1519)-N(6))-dimethyltransferase RsmA, partial [Candidatus Omnitrophota bacterium]|nr:16S rRNA (adenine(1518)-N(6)/adenine(1519)-N(6))-dimethyltransferase RsmA [Candidatus Omnitrophota bacterium]
MLTKSRLKYVFRRYDFTPLKRLGENYLIDGNIKDKIIRECRFSKTDSVLEIGPGLGALTIDLAKTGARVFAVEIDKKAYAILNELAGCGHPNLEIFNEDILKFDLKKIASGGKIKVVGNLPYYITTPIIEYLINNRHLLESVVIMVQREVANRLLAGPGTKDRSSISCFVQYFTRPEYIYTVKRTSFFPSPDVDSSILRLTVPDKPSV